MEETKKSTKEPPKEEEKHITPVDELNQRLAEEDSMPQAKIKIFENVLAMGKEEATFAKTTVAKYKKLDDITHIVAKLIERRKRFAPKTFVAQAEESKIGIERRLEDTDKELNELIQLGTELVTNIRVSNEKREVSRRRKEALKRDDLLNSLGQEQIKAIGKFDEINRYWGKLKNIREPMGLYEGMEAQKKRITALMQQKDDFIKLCQDEIKRVDAKYYEDLHNQSADIYCLVERIDNQIELMKNSYNEHIELLQRTIENERETLALAASKKWEELYTKRSSDENKKIRYQKERAQFYVNEIKRFCNEHEQLTRTTRIHLEKDAEQLQLELRTVKNNVLLNSEKLDYNYQVLQRRDEEDVIIRNQQKRRLAKVNDTITGIKRKMNNVKTNSEIELKKLSLEVSQLHAKIEDLETKFKNFKTINEKKYRAIWEINYEEVMTLLNKVLDIDKIVHEQQLGLNWIKPVIPQVRFKDFFTPRISRKFSKVNIRLDAGGSKRSSLFSGAPTLRTDEQKVAATRLLRSVIRLISDRAGFLIEDKLLSILEPYNEELKALVRLDNIFNALNIQNIDEINSLVEYFLPYSWCPNCSKGISEPVLQQLFRFQLEDKQIADTIKDDTVDEDDRFRSDSSPNPFTKVQSLETFGSSSSEEESDREINKLLDMDKKQKRVGLKKSVQFDRASMSLLNENCLNHYLVVEPVLVLTALRQFAEDNFCGNLIPTDKDSKSSVMSDDITKLSKTQLIGKQTVATYWSQFPQIISGQKMKIWKGLEHGLNHYLQILRERENLDSQCEFLRRQNAELRYLLQRFVPYSDID